MKQLIVIVFAIVFSHQAAMAQTDPGEELAMKLATKMKDSLELPDSLQQKLYEVNVQLYQQKMFERSNADDSTAVRLQYIENTRDALYQAILPEDKYLLYLDKKQNLLNNN